MSGSATAHPHPPVSQEQPSKRTRHESDPTHAPFATFRTTVYALFDLQMQLRTQEFSCCNGAIGAESDKWHRRLLQFTQEWATEVKDEALLAHVTELSPCWSESGRDTQYVDRRCAARVAGRFDSRLRIGAFLQQPCRDDYQACEHERSTGDVDCEQDWEPCHPPPVVMAEDSRTAEMVPVPSACREYHQMLTAMKAFLYSA